MTGGSEGFRRAERLRSAKDFQRISREGRRVTSERFVVLATCKPRATAAGPRLGITVSRRVGGAVARNRVKRRVREWFRSRRNALPLGVELVVIARPTVSGSTPEECDRELDQALAALIPGLPA